MKQKVLKKNKNFFKKYFVNSKKVFTFALANLKQTMTEIKVLEEKFNFFKDFRERIRCGAEVFHNLKKVLKEKGYTIQWMY